MTELKIDKTFDARIAFSIHGTNCFIVATKKLTSVPEGMGIVTSRDLSAVGVKLIWLKLQSAKGEPLRSPILIKKRFNELREKGWTVDDKAFVKKFWGARFP